MNAPLVIAFMVCAWIGCLVAAAAFAMTMDAPLNTSAWVRQTDRLVWSIGAAIAVAVVLACMTFAARRRLPLGARLTGYMPLTLTAVVVLTLAGIAALYESDSPDAETMTPAIVPVPAAD